MTAVEFRNAALGYTAAPVLEHVDGMLAPGLAVALVGPNGAGKSTLLKGTLGLVRTLSGSIRVLGTSPVRARRMVGYVPQVDTLDADFPVTAEQVVLMGRYRRLGFLRYPGRADRAAAAAALDRVGLTDRAKYRFGALSGGQRQRVLLARAIAAGPRLLLLDEPFNGLDSISEAALLGALGSLKSEGVAVMVSTHDLALARDTCEQICLLNGRQIAFGPVPTTMTAANLRATYGGRAVEIDGEPMLLNPH